MPLTDKENLAENLGFMFLSYNWKAPSSKTILISEAICRRKFHGDLECLQMCHTTMFKYIYGDMSVGTLV